MIERSDSYEEEENQIEYTKKIENKKIRKRNQKQMNINYTFNNVQESRIKKEEKDKLTEFLKEIGMQHYTDILISEGFDDIDLIIKQMNINYTFNNVQESFS